VLRVVCTAPVALATSNLVYIQGVPTRMSDILMEAQSLCGLNLLRRPLSWLILGRCDYYDYAVG
jgi:hypothetical protein